MVLSQRQGLYVAPKIQGVYHITATSTANPQKRAVATVTVLAYCDLPGALVRPQWRRPACPYDETPL
jgi:hypothetical protein